MLRFFQLSLVLLVCSATGFAIEKEPLISLRQDFEGVGMRTLEVTLESDGFVIEESIDYRKAPDQSWHVVKVVRNVPLQNIRSLVSHAAEQMKALPRNIGPSVVDSRTKSITVRVGTTELFSGWSDYEDTPESRETALFQSTWQSLLSLLETPDA
jgi:hypothetical protein